MSATQTRRRPRAATPATETSTSLTPIETPATETPSGDTGVTVSTLWLAGWTYGTGRDETLALLRAIDLDNKAAYKAAKWEWIPGAMAAYRAKAIGDRRITQETLTWASTYGEDAVGFKASECPAEKVQRTKMAELAYGSARVQWTNLVKAAKQPEVTEVQAPRTRNTAENKAAKKAEKEKKAAAAKAETDKINLAAGTRTGFRAQILMLRTTAKALKSANLKLADNDTNKALDTIIGAVDAMPDLVTE